MNKRQKALEGRSGVYKLFYYIGPWLLIAAFLLLWQAVASCLYTQIPESRINTELFNYHQKTE